MELFILLGIILIALLLLGDIFFRFRSGGKDTDAEYLMARLKESFGEVSLDALSKSSKQFLELANEALSKQTQKGEQDLEGKKKLIDRSLLDISNELEKVKGVITDLEKEGKEKFGELTSQIKTTADQNLRLQDITGELKTALSSSKIRGQWGERMAEDVLRLAGFIEGVNYLKQRSAGSAPTRPDYTFLLPHDLKVNMDVKFPLENYMKFMGAENETEKQGFKAQFLRDVKSRIKEVTTRDYINPEEHTVDYVIVFIPNEQVYSFINENDRETLDDALKNKVVICSPLTLYAILAIIRQAIDNFHLEKTASRVLFLLGSFKKQYDAFVESMGKMGKRIEDAQKEFNNLTTTRRNKLEKPLREIEDLRKQEGMADAGPEGDEDDDENLLELRD